MREAVIGITPFLVIGDLWLSIDTIASIHLDDGKGSAKIQTTYGLHSMSGDAADTLREFLEAKPNYAAPREEKEEWE